MNKDRLLRLATLLKSDAKNPQGVMFNLNYWAQDISDSSKSRAGFPLETQQVSINCSTQACAFGLAAISGIFADEGLTYELRPNHAYNAKLLVPGFRGEFGFHAAAKFFEIDMETARLIFDGSYYEDTFGIAAELAVAKRIHKIVAQDHATT
jgi:hypothetical protein